jgi:spore germination protein
VTVTPVPTAVPQCQNILGTHVVRPGESLYAIGRAYGVRPDAIAYCNSIVNPSLIYVGMSLVIPNVPWSPIPPGPVAIRQFGPDVTPCRYYHTVQWGETLFRISARYWVSMWAIAEANHIYNLNYIRAGQVLCIP